LSTKARSRGLGRGLDALLPIQSRERQTEPGKPPSLFLCPLERIVPKRDQPRRVFEEAPLDELARSIRKHGLLEPLVVRRVAEDRYELIAGERRWRACQRAGVLEAAVHVREVSDQSAFELALVENVQRENLNPIEFASAVGRLVEEFGYTQEQLADILHKDRSTLSNALRLLKLPAQVRELITHGQLSEGHGRALLAAPDDASRIRLAHKAVAQRLSVRQTEAAAKALKQAADPATDAPSPRKSPGVRDLETRISRKYGTRCDVRDRKGKGEIVIRYADLDELDRILETLLD